MMLHMTRGTRLLHGAAQRLAMTIAASNALMLLVLEVQRARARGSPHGESDRSCKLVRPADLAPLVTAFTPVSNRRVAVMAGRALARLPLERAVLFSRGMTR